MRKINIGVSVTPPNVVHTTPLRGRRRSGCSPSIASTPTSSSSTAASRRPRARPSPKAPRSPMSATSRSAAASKVQQILGLRAAAAAESTRSRERQDRGRPQGQEAQRRRRRRRRLQWRMGREVLRKRRSHGRGRPIHLAGHRRPPARPGRRPDRRRRAASRRHLPGDDSRSPASTRWSSLSNLMPNLHVQRLRRHRPTGSRATGAAARHARRHDRGQPRHLPRQGQGGADHGQGDREAARRRSNTPGTAITKNCIWGGQRGFDPKRTQLDRSTYDVGGRRHRRGPQADASTGRRT